MNPLEAVMQTYAGLPITQKIIQKFIEAKEKYDELEPHARIYGAMSIALSQPSVVSTLKNHAYISNNRNWEYITAAKSLERVVATNICRVARWANTLSVTMPTVTNMVDLYHEEVLGSLKSREKDSCTFLAFMDSPLERKKREQEREQLTAAERKKLKMTGQKVEYDPRQGKEYWEQNSNSEEMKHWREIAEQGAIQTYSKIMQPIMESIGRTAYNTRDSIQVLQTVEYLSLPEVTTFLGTCNRSIMAELFPNLIATAARAGDLDYLRNEVPKINDKIAAAWKEVVKDF